MLLGSMLSFVTVTSPAVFRTLDEFYAQKFLRFIFPRFFKFCLLIIIITGLFFILGSSFFGSIVSVIIAIGFLVNTYILMPMINQMRDQSISGNDLAKRKFNILHLISVLVFILQMIFSISILVFYSSNHILFFFKTL